jgi:hypothetical protein
MIAELTAAAAAATTTTALTGYLTAGVTEAAKTAGKEVVEQGKRLVGWLRERLHGPAKEALADLRTEPSEQTAAAFRQQLETSLAADPALLESLRALLAEVPEAVRYGEQRANVVGDRNEVYQVQGSGISIRRG